MNKNIKVTNKNGYELDYESAVQYMNDDIREQLHNELSPCTEQEFFTAYENEHEKVYNEEWVLSASNPQW
jgi:hypothetical protein